MDVLDALIREPVLAGCEGHEVPDRVEHKSNRGAHDAAFLLLAALWKELHFKKIVFKRRIIRATPPGG